LSKGGGIEVSTGERGLREAEKAREEWTADQSSLRAWTGRDEVEEEENEGASREREEAEEIEGRDAREAPFRGWMAGDAVGDVAGLMLAELEMTLRLRFSRTPS
jgi:hypothetical protein